MKYRTYLRPFACRVVPLLGLVFACTGPLAAQTSVYWDINTTTAGSGGTAPAGIWNSSDAFWNSASDGGSGTLAAWSAGNVAVFSAGTDATGSYTVAVQGTHGIRGLTFQEGTVTLQGGMLNLTAASVVDVADLLTATLSGVNLTGNFGLTKNGKGTLAVSGASTTTFSGDFRLAAGTVTLDTVGGSALGTGNILVQSSSGIVTNLVPSTLRLLADNQIFDGSQVTIISSQYRAALFDLNGFDETIGGLTVVGQTGTSNIGVRTGSGGVLTVNGDIFLHNDRGGSTGNNVRDVLITGTGNRTTLAPDTGYLDLGGGVRKITVESRTAPLYPDSDATIETIIQNGGIIKEGPQMLYLTGTNTYTGGTTINAGTLRLGAGGSTGSIVGNVVNNALLEINRSNAYTFAGDITGTGSLTKLATNVLTLTGNNSYSGLTTVSNGTLQVEKLGMAGSTTATNIGTQAAIYLGSGVNNVGLTYIGAGETTDKVLRFANTTGTATVTASGTGAMVFQNAFNFAEAGNKLLTLTGTSTAANTLQGGILDPAAGGAVSLLKSGVGTWALSGVNTYTGTTTITGGILRLSGAGALPQNAIVVQNGAFDIAGLNDVTLNGDPALKLVSTELISYAVVLGGGSAGSAASVTMAADRTLNLNSHVGFSATNNNLPATISGGTLHLGDGLRVFVVGNSSNADPDLTISSLVTAGADTILMKAGLGTLAFNQGLNLERVQVNVGRMDFGGLQNVIAGSLQVGMNSTASAYYTTPGGSLTVGGGVADTLEVGTAVNQQAYTYTSSFGGTLDLRGSQTFSADVGTVRVGVQTSPGGTNGFTSPTLPSLDGVVFTSGLTPTGNAFYMATNNTIIARTSFVLGDAASASVSGSHSIQFGEGTNVVNTPSMYLGYRKGGGTVTIRDGGSLEIRGVTTGARTALFIGNNSVNTAGATVSSVDLSTGTLVADLSTLTIGLKSNGSSAAGSAVGTLTLGTSSANLVSVSGNVILGYLGGTQASPIVSFGRGTLNMGGGSFTVGGDVEMAKFVVTGNTNTGLSTTGALNLTGGVFTVNGNITRTEDSLNRSVATVTVNGGTLDMTSGNIGSLAAPVVLNAQMGGLRGLNEFNGGAPLIKTGPGLLTLGGLNSYTGGTQVQAGTFEVLAGSRTGLGGMSVQGSTAILAGEGIVSANTTLTLGSIRAGAAGGAGHGILTFAGDLTLNGTPGSGTTLVLGITSRTGVADLATYGVAQIPEIYNYATFINEVNNIGDHYLLRVGGTFTWNNGTKLIVQADNATFAYGDVFNLLDWAGLIGGNPAFGSGTSLGGTVNDYLELPSLVGTGFYWDLSLFGSHGALVVVPEPGRASLCFLAALASCLRRRRKVGQLGPN